MVVKFEEGEVVLEFEEFGEIEEFGEVEEVEARGL